MELMTILSAIPRWAIITLLVATPLARGAVHGWAVPSPPGLFDLYVNAVQGFDITVSDVPDGPFGPGEDITFNVNISKDVMNGDGVEGVVLLGPSSAPGLLAVDIKVTAVTLRDVSLPESMRRAIAKQAEAGREKRSRIILADGEFQASERMVDAAKLYQGAPGAIKLRELQTLAEIAREKNLIVVTSGGEVGEATGTVAGLTKAFGEV